MNRLTDTALTIHVTDAHVTDAEPWNYYYCPVALALREATGEDWQVSATRAWRWAAHDPETTWRLPRTVRAWIALWESGEYVPPLPPLTLRLPTRFVPHKYHTPP